MCLAERSELGVDVVDRHLEPADEPVIEIWRPQREVGAGFDDEDGEGRAQALTRITPDGGMSSTLRALSRRSSPIRSQPRRPSARAPLVQPMLLRVACIGRG